MSESSLGRGLVVPAMSNPFKLILVILLFFLALTYVRAFTATTPDHAIAFHGSSAVGIPVTVTNASVSTLKPQFLADGPFTILVKDDPATLTVPPKGSATFTLYLVPAPALNEGDAYSAQLRVLSVGSEARIPLLLTRTSAPLLGDTSPPSPGVSAGLISGFSLSTSSVVNVVLIVIILVLMIALFARIKNRVLGGTPQ